jgi:hypothetical protein
MLKNPEHLKFLRVSSVHQSHSTHHLFVLGVFKIGFQELFALADLEPGSF